MFCLILVLVRMYIYKHDRVCCSIAIPVIYTVIRDQVVARFWSQFMYAWAPMVPNLHSSLYVWSLVMQLFDLNSRFHICMSFLAVLCYQISCTCMFTALLFWSRFHTHICILLYCFYPAFMHRYACSSAVLVQISYMYMHIVRYFSISYTWYDLYSLLCFTTHSSFWAWCYFVANPACLLKRLLARIWSFRHKLPCL